MFDLKNKVALITGARRGMGKAHALALASQGAKVVVTDIDAGECKLVADEVRAHKGEAVHFKMDVLNISEIDQVITEAVKHFGRLDILVNNAGIYLAKLALDITEEEWNKTLETNLRGQFFCAQRAAREMAKNKWGRIINVSSVTSGQIGVGAFGGAHYTASKGGIIGMSEVLAIEWAPLGINVNVVAPGAIYTAMAEASRLPDQPDQEKDAALSYIPLRRRGRPEEVSAAVVFLASEEASYVTGATLHVDGGWLAG